MLNEKLYHVLIIHAITDFGKQVPSSFIKNIKRSNLIQNRDFKLYIKLLPFNKYQRLKSNKYNNNTIIDIFNNHIISPDESLSYILKWPMLVKNIIDNIFALSSEDIPEMESNPDLLFQRLKDKRKKMYENNALLDSLVMQTYGIDIYMKYRNIDSFEERLEFIAATEHFTHVVLEERFKFAIKIKKSINLKSDRHFTDEYNRQMNIDNDTGELINKASQALTEQMREDAELAKLGVTRKINTSQENAALLKHN